MKFQLLSILIGFIFSQEIITEYLIMNQDTVDIFSYQIPNNYSENNPAPLLVAFHQWGGNENSNYYTEFDEEANLRGWFFLSPFGGSTNNYAHQNAQLFFEQELLWIINHYSIDQEKIYMIGGSMGGATGSIYANNHLNPNFPMIAATASGSGILDCERRYYEMDGNNSMTEWFGGSPDEVPFEYHRNSTVYFNDFSQSMHYNLQYTPLYLDFGSTEEHRYHAEDLYNLLLGYNNNIWIDTEPSGGHGYSVMNENHTCDWLSQFSLINDPDNINVNLDEPSRAYWIEAKNQINEHNFIRINSERCYDNTICINEFLNSDTLLLHIINDVIPLTIEINNLQYDSNITIGITGDDSLMYSINQINFEGFNYSIWDNLNPLNNIIYVDINFGNYIISLNQAIYDDINQDGIFNILDIIIIVSFILENSSPSNFQFYNADLNNDDQLNIYDIILLVNNII